MSEKAVWFDPAVPCTAVLRGVLPAVRDRASAADLLFLEHWEMCPLPGAAAALRISQIRRANPRLAAAIRAELAARQAGSAAT
jgi:hypothetical protein